MSLSWLALGRWLAGWLGGWRLLLLVGWVAGWLGGWLSCWLAKVKAHVLDMLVVLSDEEDASGCGWLASWLAVKPQIRRRGTLA